MIKRPRSHQLEDESWRAFHDCVPSRWVLRKPQPDYAIDGEVEIFDESGSSTGLLFFVQLKGTDIKEKAKALFCRIRLKTLRYYKSLPVPVLLIRYHAPSKSIYFRWSGSVDPYYTRKGSKTVKVNFSEDARWSEKTPVLLVEYLKFFRHFSTPVISLPIDFRFEFPDKEVFSFPVSVIESIIREAGRSVSEIISFSSGESSLTLSPRIKITNDLILIEIEGLTSFNLHLRSRYSKEEIRTGLPHDVFVGISFVLYLLGQINFAAEIASKHILSSRLLSNERLLFEIASCFFLARRVDMALKLSEQLLDMDNEHRFACDIFSLPAFRKVHLNEIELQILRRVLLKAIDKAKKAGNLLKAAESHYNLGNRIKDGDDDKNRREAFHHYHMASRCDPSYLKRNYFWSEIGSILFNAGKYSCSERFYRKARELGAGTESVAFWALMRTCLLGSIKKHISCLRNMNK